MLIYVTNLVLEVTRRCNMCCDHCLRGDAQNLDISDEILEIVARDICPACVTFTGGEPSLNILAISKYFALAEKNGTLPSSFYVVTNGKENQEELAMTLLHAYSKMDEPEYCGLALSIDTFHEDVSNIKGTQIFKGLSFFSDEDKAHPSNERRFNWLINTGRAYENGLGTRQPQELAESVEDMIEDSSFVSGGEWQITINTLYVSANGNVVSDCDQSYDDIDNCAVCQIQDLKSRLEAAADHAA